MHFSKSQLFYHAFRSIGFQLSSLHILQLHSFHFISIDLCVSRYSTWKSLLKINFNQTINIYNVFDKVENFFVFLEWKPFLIKTISIKNHWNRMFFKQRRLVWHRMNKKSMSKMKRHTLNFKYLQMSFDLFMWCERRSKKYTIIFPIKIKHYELAKALNWKLEYIFRCLLV